ncbi:hypothetical protein [Thalassoglobus neptunius]|uniref:hypothetical protein n=1 Tax=Thalassoglobus neptunius TaxID=1938619 RepID=UPI0018D21380|nr:hypothetical protein [Thalassoglobus neptunius]
MTGSEATLNQRSRLIDAIRFPNVTLPDVTKKQRLQNSDEISRWQTTPPEGIGAVSS